MFHSNPYGRVGLNNMRSVQFINGDYYHIFNRGVDKRIIFQDEVDFRRFYTALCVFNDTNFVSPGQSILCSKNTELLACYLKKQVLHRSQLVKIISFCLLPNHFHLMLKQVAKNGISRFLHRISSGYVHYFNKRYERSGSLFQGEFKAVRLENDSQFIHVPRYIHLNALDMIGLPWRRGTLRDWKVAEKFLDNYMWSSHTVYKGQRGGLSLVARDEVRELFPTSSQYIDFLKSWCGRSVISE